MADLQSELETNEFEFLEEACDSCDEADAVSPAVITVEKETQVKYVVKKTSVAASQCQPCEETVRHSEKVSVGKSRGTVANGTPALLSFRSGDSSHKKHISEDTIHNIKKAFSKVVAGCNIEVLKYSDLQILVKFGGIDAYQKIGKCFVNGEIGKINGLELVEIKLVTVISLHPCYLEVLCSTSDCPKLQADLSSFLVSYCSKFPWITIRETAQKALGINTDNAQAVDVVPATSIMLMFMARAQKNAQKFLQAIKIAGKDWEEISMPKEFCKNGEVFYKFSKTPGLSFSILQGSAFAGIRIMVFVRNLEEMEKFYSLITGKSPLVVDKVGEGIKYRTYSLSKNLELQLVFHPKVKLLHPGNVNLCFSISNVDKVLSGVPGNVCEVGESHWQVKDPDGNSVLLYNLLRL